VDKPTGAETVLKTARNRAAARGTPGKTASGKTATGKTRTAPSTEKKPTYFAPALEKGLDVLELLAGVSEPLNPSQIAQRLGRSLQEVYRVVVALERRGYLVRPPGAEALVLSTRLFSVATQFPPFRRIVDAAQPVINGLALESRQAVHMAMLDGTNMCIIAQVDSPLPIGVRLKVGAVSPAIRGASGRTLIAFQTEAVREWLFSQSATLLSAEHIAAARRRIEAIRARGYEMVEGEMLPGVTDLSFPVLDGAGVAMATVTMPFLSSYIQPIALADAAAMVHAAAGAITSTMGGVMPPAQLPR
jgi:DNA-binding IclR family transcriptional regulator